ncbi:MAG TPA: hypothetical protein VJ861_09460, partial [Treponemataceae bacterium]|nr:hypothetical protein [Treponemataceae bacterium]
MSFLILIQLFFVACDTGITTNKIIDLVNPPPPDIKTYTLKIASAMGGATNVEPTKSEYIFDEFIQITALPIDGYVFVKWSGTQDKKEPVLLIKIQANEWIIPIFTKVDAPPAPLTYAVKVDTAIGGTVSISPEKNEYNPNDFVKLSATPN